MKRLSGVLLILMVSLPPALARAQTPVTVRIVSPPDGTTVEPGQTLTVEVETLPIGQFAGVAILSTLTSDFKTNPPFVFNLQIPPDAPLGPQRFTAFIGLGRDNFVDTAITINVETTTPVTSIRAQPDEIGFFRSRQSQLSVSGSFADGQSRDVTKSRDTTYVSSNTAAATVTAGSLVEAIENGTAVITATYKGKSASVRVTVNSTPQGRLEFECSHLHAIVLSNPGTPLADKVEDAVAKCQTAVAELAKKPPDKQAAMGNIEGAVGDLQAAVDAGLLDVEVGIKRMDQLARAARQIAKEAIDQAIARGGNPQTINEAQQFLAQGDTIRESRKFKEAVSKYKDALAKAESS